jgi:hypothetical protein
MDGIFILHSTTKYKKLLGQKVIGMNDIPINVILDSLKTLLSNKTQQNIKNRIPEYLISYPILKHFGFVTNEKIILNLENHYGIPQDEKITVPIPDKNKILKYKSLRVYSKMKRPVYFGSDFKKIVDNNTNALFIIINNYNYNILSDSFPKHPCMSTSGWKYPQKEHLSFENFLNDLEQDLKEKSYSKIVIDLSRNSGRQPKHISGLSELLAEQASLHPTDFVIIVNNMSSSIITNAKELKLKLQALIIGVLNKEDNYFSGSQKHIFLNSSCLFITCPKEPALQSDIENLNFMPDVIFPDLFMNYVQGIDPVYHWISKN